jgi:hypothetical protein
VNLNGSRTVSSRAFTNPGGSNTIAAGTGEALTLVNGGSPVPDTVSNSGGPPFFA